jgi:hypothetical protein
MNNYVKPTSVTPSNKPGPNYPSKVPNVPSGKNRGNEKK